MSENNKYPFIELPLATGNGTIRLRPDQIIGFVPSNNGKFSKIYLGAHEISINMLPEDISAKMMDIYRS